MSTYNPVGLALRDVGAGFQGILEQEARRRSDAMQQQVALGQLGLQGQQLQNQAAAQQAQAGVSLAQVGMQGRQQELQYGLEQKKLGFEERRTAETEAAGQAQRTYQQKTLAPEIAARTRTYAAGAAAQEQQNAANNMRIPVSAMKGHLLQGLTEQYGPDQAQRLVDRGTSMLDIVTSANALPKDANGEPYFTAGQAKQYLDFTTAMNKVNQKQILTPQERQAAREHTLNIMEKDVTTNTLPIESKLAIADAMIDYPESFHAVNQTLAPKGAQLRQEAIAALEAQKSSPIWGKHKATPEEIRDIENKIVAPQLNIWRAENAAQILSRKGPREVTSTPTPTKPQPAATGTAPNTKPGLEQLAVKHATAAGLPPAMVQALVDTENAGWAPGLGNKELGDEGGVGLGQHTGPSWTRYARPGTDRRDADANLEATAKHLADLAQHYKGDRARAAAAYYSGRGKIPQEGPIPEIVIQQSSKGPITQHPRAYAERYMANLAKREQPQATTAIPAFGPPGLAASLSPVVPALGRAATTVGQAATNAGMAILSPTFGASSSAPATSSAVPAGPSLAQAATGSPPTATSTPEQDAAYRAQNQGGAGLSQEGLQAFATQELQRRYPNGADDGVHAVNAGQYGTYLVYVQGGQIIRIEKGAA